MKSKILVIVLTCSIVMNVDAQIYSYDTGLQLPISSVYDTDLMNMQLRVMAETAAMRKEDFNRYSDMAFDAYNKNRWSDVVYYVNAALNTRYYNGTLYYIRGYAYEQLGNLRAAKKDYKTGKKYNCPEAALALESLNERRKRKKKK